MFSKEVKLTRGKSYKIYNSIINGKEKERYDTIQKVIELYNTSEVLNKFIRLQLAKDKSITIQKLIIEHIENGISVKDFYYLIEYLKVSQNFSLSQKVIGMLYKLDPYRLRQQLAILFKYPPWRIHLLNFLEVIEIPLKIDIDWISGLINKLNLWETYANFPIKFEKKLIRKLLPYYISLNIQPKNIFEFYYYFHFENLTSGQISPLLAKQVPLESLRFVTR